MFIPVLQISTAYNFNVSSIHLTDKCYDSVIKQVNEKSCRLRIGAYRDGVKRKGDKIGMGV